MSIFSIFDIFGMGGLIKANLKVYFRSIANGVGHEDAVEIVLKSRYPRSHDKRRYVEIMAAPDAIPVTEEDAKKEQLRILIWAMYRIEAHLDRGSWTKELLISNNFDDKYSELYDSMKKKYL